MDLHHFQFVGFLLSFLSSSLSHLDSINQFWNVPVSKVPSPVICLAGRPSSDLPRSSQGWGNSFVDLQPPLPLGQSPPVCPAKVLLGPSHLLLTGSAIAIFWWFWWIFWTLVNFSDFWWYLVIFVILVILLILWLWWFLMICDFYNFWWIDGDFGGFGDFWWF